jgi:hypothetical protein
LAQPVHHNLQVAGWASENTTFAHHDELNRCIGHELAIAKHLTTPRPADANREAADAFQHDHVAMTKGLSVVDF